MELSLAPGVALGLSSAHAAETKEDAISLLLPAVLIACTSVSILSTDLYTPSLPDLPRLLGTTAEAVQLSVSINFFAYAAAQLVHGPLADRIGRRRLLAAGMGGFVVASIVCALARDIGELLAGRLLQGLFSSVPSVVIPLVIREHYAQERALRVMGLHGMAIGAAPMLGPLIGGYVHVWAGWRMNFVLLAVIAATVLVLVLRCLPETGVRDTTPFRPRRLVAGYLSLLGRPAYLSYVIPLAAVFGALFAFVTAGPFILIEGFGVATEDYGLYYGGVIVAFVAGNLVVSRLAGRLPTAWLARSGMILALVGGLAIAVPMAATGYQGLVPIMLGIAIFATGEGILLASGYVCLFDALGSEPTGEASALAGSLQLAAASLASFLVSVFHDGTAWPMAATVAGFAAAGIVGHFAMREIARKRDSANRG